MRRSRSVLFSVLAGVSLVGCGDALQSAVAGEGPHTQALGSGNIAPDITSCEDLAQRADALVVALADAYARLQAKEDISADLESILTDAADIAGDVGTCTGKTGVAPEQQQQGAAPAKEDQAADDETATDDDASDDQSADDQDNDDQGAAQQQQQQQQGQQGAVQQDAQQQQHHSHHGWHRHHH